MVFRIKEFRLKGFLFFFFFREEITSVSISWEGSNEEKNFPEFSPFERRIFEKKKRKKCRENVVSGIYVLWVYRVCINCGERE